MELLKNRRLVIIALVCVVLIPFIFSLGYLQFGRSSFLPEQPSKEVTIDYKPESPSQTTPTTNLNCPSIKSFCQNAKEINKDGKFALGANIPKGSEIFAAFDGETSTLVGQGTTIIYLNNKTLGLVAVYTVEEEYPIEPKFVKAGDKIAQVGGKRAGYETSLIFQLFKGDQIKGEAVKLTPKDFKP